MSAVKKIILGSIRGIAGLVGAGDWVERRLESLWRARHHKDVVAKLEDTVQSILKEKETLAETVAVLDQANRRTEFYLSKEHRFPGIVFTTMPKSASVYIAKTLADSLDIEYREAKVAHGFFPRYFVMPNALERIAKGNVIRQEHFDASPVNIRHLGRFIDRLIVHVRDPRQATLSWLHHTNRLLKVHPYETNYTSFTEPDGYIDWPLDRQLDWHIDTQLRAIVGWLREWADYVDTGGTPRVLFTGYEDMLADEASFFCRILDFFEIPRGAFDLAPAEMTAANNYRQGTADEWIGVYTDAQKRASADIMGADLMARFGWADGRDGS